MKKKQNATRGPKRRVQSRNHAKTPRLAQRLGTVLEGIDDAFIALDRALTITYFNAAAGRMFARASAQAVGKRFVEAFPEASGSGLAAKLEEAVKRQNVLSFRTELGGSGRRKSYATRLRPVSAGVSVFCRATDGSERAPQAREPA